MSIFVKTIRDPLWSEFVPLVSGYDDAKVESLTEVNCSSMLGMQDDKENETGHLIYMGQVVFSIQISRSMYYIVVIIVLCGSRARHPFQRLAFGSIPEQVTIVNHISRSIRISQELLLHLV